MEWFLASRWSPYIVGGLIGILSWISFLISDRPIGCSTAFSRTSGMIEKFFRKGSVNEKPYYQKFKPVIDWEWMLVLGVVIGSFISSMLSGNFKFDFVPSLWQESVGNNSLVRLSVALVGGIAMGFGARWAGGCTSGHGISGTMQLAVSSWIAAISFFAGGILTAILMFNFIF
jgi:uncharacterized membrane protein YedE/YeeE